LALPACGGAAANDDPGVDATAAALTERLNAVRAEQRLPSLRLHAELSRFAARRAREIAAQGSLGGIAAGNHQASLTALRDAGYEPHMISEVYAQVSGTPAEVVAGWRTQGDATWSEVLRADWRDLGIGISQLDGQPLYALVFAQPQAEFFAAETAGLADAAAVRAQLLAAVNEARKSRRLPPLRLATALNRAAQRYAELMLATGHYGHAGPRGDNALERAERDGYEALVVAENLAKGQTRVADAMAGWLESPAHLRNIVSPEFAEAGFGVAVGRGPDGLDVVWVQLFGARRF
jgi:uncharacterized protein YkwD